MKPIGKINLGDLYLEPWKWDARKEVYVRFVRKNDGSPVSEEQINNLLDQAGVGNLKINVIEGYANMERADRNFQKLSKMLEKVKSFI